ncbi:phage holin family protein [Oceanisphaera sediminis]|uniref:phage holin family protein n=1 Tax=Oceanisphaera sediminis TaxID=981381 RepID=UPI0031EBB323
MVSYLLTYAVFALCLVIFFRLFTYERNGARFRRDVSVLATLVMMSCVTAVVQILAGDFAVQPSAWPLVVMQAVLAVGLIRARGNLALILFSGKDMRRG